jgi:hypothetical protein
MRPNFRSNPAAWLTTPRNSASPAEYACSVERARSGLPMARIALSIAGWLIALLGACAAIHFVALAVAS